MSTDIALTRPEPMMDRDSLRNLMDQAIRYVESGLLPNTIKTPQQALIVMAQGRELGIPPTVALRGIVVVQGKPTCSAELMMALVHRAYGQSAMRVFKTDNESCTVQYRQQGWDGVSEYTFSMDDAKRANLLKSQTWTAYPAAMLRARAISATVRFAFPEVISGVYTPDEVGAGFSVVDGEVVPSDQVPNGSEALGAPVGCGTEKHLAYWFKAVTGTRFEDDDTRHKFINYHTKGACESLGEFLDTASEDEAHALIVSIEKRIEAEAKKARTLLIDQLQDAVRQVNEAGGDMEIPEKVDTFTDDDIRAMLEHARLTIERVEQMAVPA